MLVACSQRDVGRVSVLSAPASTPIAIDGDGGVKKHLRIDHDDEDVELLNAVNAAVGEIDAPKGWLGRSLISRTLRLTFDGLPPAVVCLPGPPVTQVLEITVRGSDDTLRVVYSDTLAIDTIGLQADLTAEPAVIWAAAGWPSDIKGGIDSMRVDYVAGYATPNDIPKRIRQWLLMRVGELYRDRESSTLGVAANRLPHADRLLDGLRVYC